MRRGSTLIELVVVLLIVGIATGLASLAIAQSLNRAPDGIRARLEAGRTSAIRGGRMVPVVVHDSGARGPGVRKVLFLPDGRAIGAGVDPLTGAPADAAH